MRFRARNLQFTGKSLPLHQFFIVLDFKVNKGWSTAVLLFLFIYSQSTNPIKYPIKQVSILLTKR